VVGHNRYNDPKESQLQHIHTYRFASMFWNPLKKCMSLLYWPNSRSSFLIKPPPPPLPYPEAFSGLNFIVEVTWVWVGFRVHSSYMHCAGSVSPFRALSEPMAKPSKVAN
jgi:hypothetical protein